MLRLVTSGFLPGDDWADEYEAMLAGGAMFRATLAEYLTHFTGRTATPVTAFGPPVPDWPAAWATLRAALGLGETVRPGDRVRITPDGLPPIDGTVYFANAQTLGIRTTDAMYRLFQGMPGYVIAMHHVFSDIDLHRT